MADYDPEMLVRQALVDTNIALWIWRKRGNKQVIKERESLRDMLKSVQDTHRREAKPL